MEGDSDKAASIACMPSNLMEATANLKKSKLARELFGETFVDHYVKTREWEWRQWLDGVTDWELKRYFEIICCASPLPVSASRPPPRMPSCPTWNSASSPP